MADTNENQDEHPGWTHKRAFRMFRERYFYDAGGGPCSGEGWEQWDTEEDASYYGVWVNHTRMVLPPTTEQNLRSTQ